MSLLDNMSRWSEERAARAQAIDRSLAATLDYLRDLGAQMVVLFGSAAERPGAFSDIDLIVVMPDHRSSADWWSEIYREAPRRVATDFLVYNQSDFETMKTRSRLVRRALATGRVILEGSS